MLQTNYQTTNFRLFKLEELVDDNFKFDENDRKLSKRVENTGKRRNCSLRAISPFPSVFKRLVSQGRQKVSLCGNGLIYFSFSQCFQKACFPGASKGVIVWEWVNILLVCNMQPDLDPKRMQK